MRHWQAGIVLAALVVTSAAAAQQQTRGDLEVQLKAAMQKELVDGDLKGAIAMYERIVAGGGGNRAVAARALLSMGQCYEKLGDAEARKAYDRLVREYADQREVASAARARLAAMGGTPAAAGAATLSVRRVWAGADITGKVSADGRFASFTDWSANGNVAIRDLATGQSRLLTSDGNLRGGGGFAEPSVPSPDGKAVAYAWSSSNGRELRVVGLDGADPRVLRAVGNGVLHHVPLAWSPDSRTLLAEFVKGDGTRDMMLVTVADGSSKLLKAVGKDVSPGGVFSPDGRYIAWATRDGLSLLDLQTLAETPLITDRAKHGVMGWAPDGGHILFSSERSGSADVWLVPVAGAKAQGEPVFVKKDAGFLPMGFTRAGAFYYGVNNNVWDVKIAELNPAGGTAGPAPSAFQRGNTRSPAWSPDGRSLAAVDAREPSQAVIIRSMDTGEERELRVGDRTIGMGGIRWTPDGKAVVVPASESGKGENLFRIDVQTGQVTALMPLPALGGWPRFQLSRDGTKVYYVRPPATPTDSVGARLMAHDLRSGQETTVIAKRGLYTGALSPDGQHVLVGAGEGRFRIAFITPVAGNELRELFRVDGKKETFFGGGPSWSPDGHFVLYLTRPKGQTGPWQAWHVGAEGGEPQRVGQVDARQLVGLALHPDGRRLAISDVRVDLELWVMENFLPKPAGAPGSNRNRSAP